MIKNALIALGLMASGVGATATSALGREAASTIVDTCGGTRLVLQASDDARTTDRANDLDAAAAEVLNERVGAFFGQRDQYAKVQDHSVAIPDRLIEVSLPHWDDATLAAIAPLFERVEFGFFDVESINDGGTVQNLAAGQIHLPDAYDPVRTYVLNDVAVLDGASIEDAQVSFDQQGRPAIAFSFDRTGAKVFGQYTSENIGNPFAIVMRGEVFSAPVIQSAIFGGSGMLTGDFTVEETHELAAVLQGGVMPFDLNVVSETPVDGSDPSADFCP
ncbi:hypothetical protein Q4555_12055 [Octadecabacter sp. 1_MG-2023]|uniref:preprotein translocase subunit SecD n=1 Tax=unclassified Octadecabacter TaxID=196158 RepID=UPI001C09D68C|nr:MULTISPECIES: hypothetical protein [unclassified Octadecabacter]MBU2993751.1 hypothetical protein [Octadecabacter sp. B2R22]MDO6735404.1 hypothetical protein [Octadecabacter sp. 1_MG-2023]